MRIRNLSSPFGKELVKIQMAGFIKGGLENPLLTELLNFIKVVMIIIIELGI